jgi:hypothetical protein
VLLWLSQFMAWTKIAHFEIFTKIGKPTQLAAGTDNRDEAFLFSESVNDLQNQPKGTEVDILTIFPPLHHLRNLHPRNALIHWIHSAAEFFSS